MTHQQVLDLLFEKYYHCLFDPPSSNLLSLPKRGRLPMADADEGDNALDWLLDKMLCKV